VDRRFGEAESWLAQVERCAAAQAERSEPMSCGRRGLELQLRARGSTYSNDHYMYKRTYNIQKCKRPLLDLVRKPPSQAPRTRRVGSSLCRICARSAYVGVFASTLILAWSVYVRTTVLRVLLPA
jgi:hypothetical protein